MNVLKICESENKFCDVLFLKVFERIVEKFCLYFFEDSYSIIFAVVKISRACR